MRLPVNRVVPLGAMIAIGVGSAAAGSIAADRVSPPRPAPVNSPAADYPVIVGEPFTIGDTLWTPLDQMNYDAVGHAIIVDAAGFTAAHKTLPLPSYAEVTSLDTGRTVLVRIERRGPMTNEALVELSSTTATRLGLTESGEARVRLRRVNPPEDERALLRAGISAPQRMDTPEGLLKVLRRKLVDQSPLMPSSPAEPSPAQTPAPPTNAGPVAQPAPSLPPRPANQPVTSEAPGAAPTHAPDPVRQAGGSLVVQVAAFSSEASARKVAYQLGGSVSKAGKFWRVRLGRFSNRVQASAALEKARTAGYRDARIQSAD